jgi:drug/metabolite transporter (DMT)-like permease
MIQRVGWLFACWLLSGIWAVLAKYSSDKLGSTWSLVFANVFFLPPILWIAVRNPIPTGKPAIAWGVATGVVGVISAYAYFRSLDLWPGSVVAVVNEMHVILTVLVFLAVGEKLTAKQWAGVVLGIVAAYLIVGGAKKEESAVADGRSIVDEQVVRDRLGRSQGAGEDSEQVRSGRAEERGPEVHP